MVKPQVAYSPDFAGLLQLVAFLRGPEGCPWDKKQTSDSLTRQFLEECYEVIEAIDDSDPRAISEELGDVLLHVAFQIRIAAEHKDFSPTDVFQRLQEKLVNRHPHVFGTTKVQEAEEVETNWEELKRIERKGTGESSLDGVPKTMPSLSYAQAIQIRAGHVGFDWQNVDAVLDKVNEEIKDAATHKEREAEIGDLFFALVNLSRWHDIDAESALRKANKRFYGRFRHMEQWATNRDRNFSTLSVEEKNILWNQAKETV